MLFTGTNREYHIPWKNTIVHRAKHERNVKFTGKHFNHDKNMVENIKEQWYNVLRMIKTVFYHDKKRRTI